MAIFSESIYTPDRRGRTGSTVWQKNQFGNMERTRVFPKNPKTEGQVNIRDLQKTLAREWGSLTEDQRNYWIAQAQDNPIMKNGRMITLTGFLLFMKLNRNLQTINQTLIMDCPQNLTFVATAVANMALTVLTTPGSEDISTAFDGLISSTEKVEIWATKVLKPGRKLQKTSFRLIGVKDHTFTTGTSIKSLYLAKFTQMPATGAKVAAMFKIIDTVTGLEKTSMQSIAIAHI